MRIELNPPVIGNAFRILSVKKYRDHTHWTARYDFIVKPHQVSKEDSEENLSTEEDEITAEDKTTTELITGGMMLSSLTFLLEATSCIDYIGDVLVLYQLFQAHPAWTTLSVYFMVSPFFVSYVPLINYQISSYKL